MVLADRFKKALAYEVELEGDVDGQKFSIHGKGSGDARTGEITTKYVCTTGDCPVSWVSLITSLSYGAKCFVRYPEGIKDFFKSAINDGGYVQERTITHENDGVYKTRAEVTMDGLTIRNKVTLTGTGFSADGNIRGKKLTSSPPQVGYVIAHGDGIRIIYKNVYPTSDGGMQVVDTNQINTPLKVTGNAAIPEYHHIRSKIELSKHDDEAKDHIIIAETNCAFDPYFQ